MALPLLFAGVIARFPAGLAIYSITTSFWSLGQQVVFWRASRLPVPPIEPAAVRSSPADAAEIPAPVAARPPAPIHSRSKKKRRSRSQRARA
jgi:hypothetical protein